MDLLFIVWRAIYWVLGEGMPARKDAKKNRYRDSFSVIKDDILFTHIHFSFNVT